MKITKRDIKRLNESLKNWIYLTEGKHYPKDYVDTVLILDSSIPTTKICMNCGKIHDLKLSQRIFKCNCGIKEDRDIHAAKNMIEIAKMINGQDNLTVPTEHREFKRVEFLKSYKEKFNVGYETMKHEAHIL